ncbi:MAG: CvpA family protein [Candidatus Omnitrophica bacterium]|nr:CvpA family protein [Candidatus Omnitrophota bacterium]MDD5437013.1 CvpA family protein [Candidatus Omnitrophota bacterium]
MEILTKINWVDVLILILVLRTTYVSLQDGLSHEIFPLIGSICMLIFSLHYYTKIAEFFYNIGFTLPMVFLNLVGFVVVFISIGLLFKLIKIFIDKIIKVSWHPLIERFGGLLAGIVRGSILTSTVLIIIVLIPLPYLQWSVRDRSLAGPYFLRIGPAIYEKTCRVLPTVTVGGSPVDATKFTQQLMSEKSVVDEGKKEEGSRLKK